MKTVIIRSSEVLLYTHELQVPDNATHDDIVEAFYALPDIQNGTFEPDSSESFQIDSIQEVTA